MCRWYKTVSIEIIKPREPHPKDSENHKRIKIKMLNKKTITTNDKNEEKLRSEKKNRRKRIHWVKKDGDDQQRQSTCYCVINENIFGCNKKQWNHKLASFPGPFFSTNHSVEILTFFLLFISIPLKLKWHIFSGLNCFVVAHAVARVFFSALLLLLLRRRQ